MTLRGFSLVVLCVPLAACDPGGGSESAGESTGTSSDGSGSSTSDGSSASEGASTGTTDPGADSTTGSEVSCDDYPYQATVEQVAATPREDADAETLALLASGEFTAPDALYERVRDDLAAIRTEEPMLVDHHARWPWGFGAGVPVSFDEEGTALMQAGTYDGWDCPNERYGVVAEPGMGLEDTAYLDIGDKRLHNELLAAEYLELPHVVYAGVPLQLDGSFICLEQDGDVDRYLFALGRGDCPSGCTEWTYWEYSVDSDGAVTFDGQSDALPAAWSGPCPWD